SWSMFMIFLFHAKESSVSNYASFLGLGKGTEMTSLIVAGASVNTTILSDNNNASSILCVMNKIDCSCCSQVASNHFCISIRVNSSNAEKGSSKQSICWGLNKDRKSTRLNSSHVSISYAVFCLKKTTVHHVLSRIPYIIITLNIVIHMV